MEKLLVDSYVFLDVIMKTKKMKKAMQYLERIKKGKATGVISTFTILEVKYHVLKRLGHEKAEDATYLIETFPNTEIAPIDDDIAELAADIRYKYYDKKNKKMSFGDSVLVATAIINKCTKIVSGESDFKDIEEIKSEIY